MAEDLFSSPTPFTPPTTEEDRLSWLRLIRSRRVGPTTFLRLLKEYGSARKGLQALPEIARSAGLTRYEPCCRAQAQAEIDAAHRVGAQMICLGTPEYPTALAEITDPPPLLWCVGDCGLLKRPQVAIVGARNASSLGVRMARHLAAGLGEDGFAVVSGLARGTDAAAHDAALPFGTVAVLAGGVDRVYPVENSALMERIATEGLLLSEQPMGVQPQARHFPTRNRIISGLAHAVIVVEAAARSGSLITARDALDQGREVMAVPGHPFDARAAGCNMLIRDGAILVRSPEDVRAVLVETPTHLQRFPSKGSADTKSQPRVAPLSGLAPESAPRCAGGTARILPPRPEEGTGKSQSPRAAPATPQDRARDRKTASDDAAPEPARPALVTQAHFTNLNVVEPGLEPARSWARRTCTVQLHDAILSRLGPSPLAEDQLIRDIDLPAAQVAPALLTLELEGRIARQPGGLLARVL